MLQNMGLAQEKDFHGIDQFSNAWNESNRITVPCCFPRILAPAFCRLPDIHAGSGELDCLTRSSFAGSCSTANVAYDGKLMSCRGNLEEKEMAAQFVNVACMFFWAL